MKQLIGPVQELLTMNHLPDKGAIKDDQMEVIKKAGVIIENGHIIQIGSFAKMASKAILKDLKITELQGNYVATPGLIDTHTHMCYGGSRASDYARRVSGAGYQEIAASGGGIKDTVRATRQATLDELTRSLKNRVLIHLKRGVTTSEVKSGYGLNKEHELKMLHAIQIANKELPVDLIPTCLAAHVCPPEFKNTVEYISYIIREILPELKKNKLSNRVDIFIEKNAFSKFDAKKYLSTVKQLGFDITIHADQFSVRGSKIAAQFAAISADHLEASTDKEIDLLAKAGVIGTVLPGASLGLGMPYAPARKMLDAGMSVVIASDWNPGSAPMGDLLLQAAVIGAAEKLSMAETWAGITTRAANALKMNDRGILKPGNLADILLFPTSDYREVLYNQGMLKPSVIIKRGEIINTNAHV